MNATMTKGLREAAEAVLTERWERELKALGLDQRRAAKEIAKLSDKQLWWALKNGA